MKDTCINQEPWYNLFFPLNIGSFAVLKSFENIPKHSWSARKSQGDPQKSSEELGIFGGLRLSQSVSVWPLTTILVFWGYSCLFRGCSGVLWDVPGVFRGCSGLFRGVPGVFRKCSRVYQGCSGVFRGVPGCSGSFPGFTDTPFLGLSLFCLKWDSKRFLKLVQGVFLKVPD